MSSRAHPDRGLVHLSSLEVVIQMAAVLFFVLLLVWWFRFLRSRR